MLSYSFDLNNCFPCSSVSGDTCSSLWWIRWSETWWGRASTWRSRWWWSWRRWRWWRWWRWWKRRWRRRVIWWWIRWRAAGGVHAAKAEVYAEAAGALPVSRSCIWVRWSSSSWSSCSSWSSSWCSSASSSGSSQWSPLQEDGCGVLDSETPPPLRTSGDYRHVPDPIMCLELCLRKALLFTFKITIALALILWHFNVQTYPFI